MWYFCALFNLVLVFIKLRPVLNIANGLCRHQLREWRLTASNFGAVITSIRNGKIPLSLLKKLFNEYGPLDKVQVNSCTYI